MNCIRQGRIVRLIAVVAMLFPFKALNGQDSGSPSMLYRGRLAPRYVSKYNGTPYWDTLSFRSGTVMYNGLLYEGVPMKIDAVEQKLVVKMSDTTAATVPDTRQVEWLRMGDDIYVNLRYQNVPDAPEGFFKVVVDAQPAVLQQVIKRMYSRAGDFNGGPIGYYDPQYDINVTNYFSYVSRWWILDDGVLERIGKGKARRLIRKSQSDGSFFSSLSGWHPVEGTGSDLLPPSVPKTPVVATEDLPLTYFDKGMNDVPDLEAVDARYRNKLYVIGNEGTRRPGGKVTVSGVTLDDEGNRLASVIVFDEKTGIYTNSGQDGRFSITIPEGETVIVFSDAEKEEQRLRVELVGDGSLNVTLHDRSTMLDEAMVSAESMKHHRSAAMGVEKINSASMAKIPTVFGEKDVLKVVLTLPGVQTVGEASAGFNVRGGSSDQNLVLFNGNAIYYPSHFFGINSVFNPDLVENVELYKGSIPAGFGGRISSVLDVQCKDGDTTKIKGSLGLGILTSRAHVEGPVTDKLSLTLGGRTTYSNWILKTLPSESEFSGGDANFYDINLGLTYRLDDNNTFRAYFYNSRDGFSFGRDTTFKYGNTNGSIHWQHKTGKRTLNVSAGADHYGNAVQEVTIATEGYRIETAVDQFFVRGDYVMPMPGGHRLNYGGEALLYSLQRGHRTAVGEQSNMIEGRLPRELAFQPSIFASDKWTPSKEFELEGGLRLSSCIGGGSFQGYPEVRLSGRYSPSHVLSLKAGVNTMAQYIHLISNTLSISPMDTWKMSDADIPMTTGWQGTAGAYWTFPGGKIDLSAEAYYKNLHNYIDYASMAQLVMNEHISDDLVRTRGKSYGVELMARKSVGRLNGWISYTWSRSFLKDIQYEGVGAINGGSWYRASSDKPHDFKLVFNYAFTRRYSFSLNVDYSTGRPVTLPSSYYYYAGGIRLAYSDRNAYRVPDYFRMDVAFNIDPGHYLKALAHASVTIGCYNVTGRKNAYSVYYDTRMGASLKGHMLSIFAVPVPYVNLNILF